MRKSEMIKLMKTTLADWENSKLDSKCCRNLLEVMLDAGMRIPFQTNRDKALNAGYYGWEPEKKRIKK